MALGFTKSKVDSNLYFKFEDGRPVIIDRKRGTHQRCKKETCCHVRDKGIGYDALPSRHGGVVECGWNIHWIREVCNIDPKKFWDDGLQGHGHTYGIEPEAIE